MNEEEIASNSSKESLVRALYISFLSVIPKRLINFLASALFAILQILAAIFAFSKLPGLSCFSTVSGLVSTPQIILIS